MKTLFSAFTILLLSLTAYATEADVQDLAKKAQISDHCAAQILAAATKECNQDSKAAEHSGREHACFYNWDISSANQGAINIGFTVGDADEWNYVAYVSDESDADSCDFTIKAAN